MANKAVLLFDLKERIIETIRGLKMLEVNHKMKERQIESFHTLLSDVGSELQACQNLFAGFQNIDDPKVAQGNIYEKQCLERMKSLASTLGMIEVTNNGPMTQAFPVVLKEWFLLFEKQLGEMKEKLEKLDSVITHLHQVFIPASIPSPNKPDSFNCVNMEPVNPENIVLHFEENSGTPESAFKKAIFDQNSFGTVTAVASGMGGIGRTCALRGVGLHEDALKRFPDGIFYMSLGAESGKAELIRNIAEFVRRSGGYKKSK